MTETQAQYLSNEHAEQAAVIKWAKQLENAHPELKLLFAIPNGELRKKRTANKLRAEGAKAGVPDLFLPVARKGVHGLFIEMKYGNNKPSAEQMEWMNRLEGQEYAVFVCWSFDAARKVIEDYLSL